MTPEYMGDSSKCSIIILCVSLLVLVIKQSNCSGLSSSLDVYDNNGVGVSPG